MSRSTATPRSMPFARSLLCIASLLVSSHAARADTADAQFTTSTGDEIHISAVEVGLTAGSRITRVSLMQAGPATQALIDAFSSGDASPYLELVIESDGSPRSAALQPSDAFFVKCDRGTTTSGAPCQGEPEGQGLVKPTRLSPSLEWVRVIAIERANFVGMDSFIYTVIDDGSSITVIDDDASRRLSS